MDDKSHMRLPGPWAWQFRELRPISLVIGLTGALAVILILLTPMPAGAVTISPPTSKNGGTAATGSSTLTFQLGSVTATAPTLTGFTVTVSATDFTTGAGTANETISKSIVFYWSGIATSFSGGILGSYTPGQATFANKQDLSTSRTAFSGTAILGTTSVTWNPTIVINLPAKAVAGSYSGTITHSVA